MHSTTKVKGNCTGHIMSVFIHTEVMSVFTLNTLWLGLLVGSLFYIITDMWHFIPCIKDVAGPSSNTDMHCKRSKMYNVPHSKLRFFGSWLYWQCVQAYVSVFNYVALFCGGRPSLHNEMQHLCSTFLENLHFVLYSWFCARQSCKTAFPLRQNSLAEFSKQRSW